MLRTLFPNELPQLFLFDMDHTLIDNDCDLSWKTFLVNRGMAPKESLVIADKYYEAYLKGELNESEFITFQLAEFNNRCRSDMETLASEHFSEVVQPKIYEKGMELVREIQAVSIPIAIETATNSVVASPVSEYFGIETVLATEITEIDHSFRASISGHYNCGTGKIISATQFCSERGIDLSQVAYFGDSLSDIPLLSNVGFPVVTNGSTEMLEIAFERGWSTVHF